MLLIKSFLLFSLSRLFFFYVNKLKVLLNLKESDLQKDYLDIEFIFKLRNTVGYEYTQTVDVRFSKIPEIQGCCS